jgi:predicted DsbA family dithiol-disulfide isomerase
MDMTTVQFWFDPICPWTYVTYRWLVEARQARGLTVTPRLLSLYLLNRDRPDTGHRASHQASRGLERFLAWARAAQGDQVMERAYDELGKGLFIDGQNDPALLTGLVGDVAEKLSLSRTDAVAAAADFSWDGVIAADHDEAMALVGDEVGSPVIALADGAAFFGPVLTRAPRGEDAGRIWDGCVALASHPDFYELKRSRGAGAKAVFD